jgi:hypothetical protein
MQEDYFTAYMRYAGAGVSEPPATFHRWSSISIIGALLGRQYSFPFGHSRIYPNNYINFMGDPGTRKSTAINIGAKLLKATGYSRFAADKVSKEKFLLDMRQYDETYEDDDLIDLTLSEPAESYIVAEEFTDFVGNNNMEFLTLLTKLWDNPDLYTQPKIHGPGADINQPTVNILSGNTPQGFALAFPPEAIGNGFLSRTLFIHGDVSGRKVTFPPKPDENLKQDLIAHLKKIKYEVKGEAVITQDAMDICDRVYREFCEVDDTRFRSYSTRRFTHVLKIALIISAASLRTTVTADDIIKANTVLHLAECKMPKALGEYGKSKLSDQTGAILSILNQASVPMNPTDLWKKVAQDFTKISEMGEVLRNLEHAERIQKVTMSGKTGFLPMVKPKTEWAEELINTQWLTLEELS